MRIAGYIIKSDSSNVYKLDSHVTVNTLRIHTKTNRHH